MMARRELSALSIVSISPGMSGRKALSLSLILRFARAVWSSSSNLMSPEFLVFSSSTLSATRDKPSFHQLRCVACVCLYIPLVSLYNQGNKYIQLNHTYIFSQHATENDWNILKPDLHKILTAIHSHYVKLHSPACTHADTHTHTPAHTTHTHTHLHSHTHTCTHTQYTLHARTSTSIPFPSLTR